MVLCGVLTGCGGQGVPVPSERFHRLTVDTPAAIDLAPKFAGIIEVDRFRATGVLHDRAIIFVEHEKPNVMHQYHYQLWADSPPRMLQQTTVDYLRAAHLADQVVATGLRVDPDYTLSGDIKKLEHIVGNSSSIQVEIEFGLRDYKNNDVTWLKRYTVTKKVDDDTVSAATRAISEAVEEILTNLSADLARN